MFGFGARDGSMVVRQASARRSPRSLKGAQLPRSYHHVHVLV